MQPAIPDAFWNAHPVNRLRSLSPRQLEHAGRLARPVVRRAGQSRFVPVSWDEALAELAGTLQATPPDASFFYFSGRSSNEAGFLLQLLLPSGERGRADGEPGHRNGDGGDPASNHPRLMTSLMRLRRRGGRVIVVNPVREPGLERFKVPSDVRSMLFGTRMASRYVHPRPGGDLAWDEVEASSGVGREEIWATAAEYATAERVVFSWAMGITHHTHGTASVQAIANLALIRGMVGKPGAGLMPIRSEGQFNTVVYEEEDVYRGQTARDILLLHPHTADGRGLSDGQRVRVTGPGGTMPNVRISLFERIRPDAGRTFTVRLPLAIQQPVPEASLQGD